MTIYPRIIRFSSIMDKRLLLLILAVVLTTEGQPLPDAPTVITRAEWGAQPPNGPILPLTVDPPPYVVIHHGATVGCTTTEECKRRVRAYQNYHMTTKNWSDIAYNFLVGEDGMVYEGRGWGKTGSHAKLYNDKSIGICVIGNYVDRNPNTVAIDTLQKLISYGVSLGKISTSYALIGHRQVVPTICPGDKFYQLIQTWPHWVQNP